MTDPKPYPHRRDDLDGNAHCRCGVMAVHDPKLGETWGRNCPAALRERVAELEQERTTHLLGVGHPMWLPSVADALDHPDPFNAPPDDVLDRVRAMVAERDALAARVEQLSDRVTAAEGRLELAAMAGGGAK